jgi:hypothetical protein
VERIDTTPRYRIGRDLTTVDLADEVACLEGQLRLRPGHVIELVGVPSDHGLRTRRAMVESWSIARLGKNGPIYRGHFRWLESGG